jgi:hypothetical protein
MKAPTDKDGLLAKILGERGKKTEPRLARALLTSAARRQYGKLRGQSAKGDLVTRRQRLREIDLEEAAHLAEVEQEYPLPGEGKKAPGVKPDPAITAAAEEAKAAIDGGVVMKRALGDAAERHGVLPESVRTRLRRMVNSNTPN